MKNRRQCAIVNPGRWAAYVVAGVSGLACSPSATADITFVEPGVQLRDNAPGDGYFGQAYSATFGDPGARLLFQMASSETGPGEGVLALLATHAASQPSFQMSFAGSVRFSSSFFPYNVASGNNVSQLNMISGGTAYSFNLGNMASPAGYVGGNFLNRGGFMAFQFNVGNGTQYGWAELSLDAGSPANQFTLERIAWADPGEVLRVGQIPEPGSLGLLAIGAFGLLMWRRNRDVGVDPLGAGSKEIGSKNSAS